jgi:hypothetical protein
MDSMTQGIRDLYSQRYGFCPRMRNFGQLVREHSYFVLLTLVMNEGVAFSYDQLAAHMPFSSSGSWLGQQWQQAVERWPFLRALIHEANGLAIHRHTSGVPEAMQIVADLEELPKEKTFPPAEDCRCKPQLHYWDRSGQHERQFTSTEIRNRPLENNYRVAEFAFPFRLEYIFANDVTPGYQIHLHEPPETPVLPSRYSAFSVPQGLTIERDERFLAQKNSDSARKLLVARNFTPSFVDGALVQRMTLLTPQDLYRFEHAGLYDTVSAPTLPEWNALLTCYGHAGTAVLNVLKGRQTTIGKS